MKIEVIKNVTAESFEPSRNALKLATRLVRQVCRLSGDVTLLDSTPRVMQLRCALERHDTPWLYDWLMSAFSYQGISDQAAWTFIEKHGNASWKDIGSRLSVPTSCGQLKSYWHFYDCGYLKSRQTCQQPDNLSGCPLPALTLRNGRLNQAAFSLFLFVRDVCDSDFAGWIERKLRPHCKSHTAAELHTAREALLTPMREIFGISDKVLSMTLATLLLGAPSGKEHWVRIGSSMIAVDTLVHNFLHRTGILQAFGIDHAYGSACYGEEGCVGAIGRIAAEIDARAFNPRYPRVFARFVQHAIWQYCAQDALDLCNGNQIDDDLPCSNTDCHIYSICGRVPLYYNAII